MDDKIVPPILIPSTKSALTKTLAIICGKWRLHIIFQLGTEARRYGELRRMIPDVSEKVLIQELKALVALGVLEKKSYNEIPPRVEYGLTAKGIEILPTLQNLITVGETFLEINPLEKYALSGPLKVSDQMVDVAGTVGKSTGARLSGKYGIPAPLKDGKQKDGVDEVDGKH